MHGQSHNLKYFTFMYGHIHGSTYIYRNQCNQRSQYITQSLRYHNLNHYSRLTCLFMHLPRIVYLLQVANT